MNFVRYYYYDIWNKYGDPRVNKYPLMDGGPWTTLTFVAIYLYISNIAGPKFMKNRKPFDLRKTILIYNIFLAFYNLYDLFLIISITNYGLDTLKCEKIDFSSTDPSDHMVIRAAYQFFISKFIDFGDTFFFVLRKKDQQLSFLHLYHHSIMPAFSWLFLKFIPGKNPGFIALINTFVHVIMYSYYALSTFPSLRPHLWWKKYLTTLQLVQFVLILMHAIRNMIVPECRWPSFFKYVVLFNTILFFYLFYSFYKKTYNKTKPNSNDKPETVNGKKIM